MKININNLKTVPKQFASGLELCVFGNPSEEIKAWMNFHQLVSYASGKFTNIKIPIDICLSELFVAPPKFEYLDGFSPNLNKKLHVGHFSNLVLAKAFVAMGVAKNTVAIYGDTLEGTVSKQSALSKLNDYCTDWDYKTDKYFFASEMKYSGTALKDGTAEYEGTKIFDIGDEKIVGIKSNGQTSYFYQDVALAETLNALTLYLTGKEQCNHFLLLKKMYPHTHHIGLGLVKAHGQKMASRIGNVIYIEDFVAMAKEMFGEHSALIYNVFAGCILKSSPDVDKNIDMDLLNNPKNSGGLYISYTMARMHSAGLDFSVAESPSQPMEFAFLKALSNFSPHYLFECIMDVCKNINALYITHSIKDNPSNKIKFQLLLADLLWGCKKLGLGFVEKV